jgi:hypothetical protein
MIVVSATGAFLNKPSAESAQATKSEGRHLAQLSRNVVHAATRGLCDTYADSMHRVTFNRENPPDGATIKQLEGHEIDCEVAEDEEGEEWFHTRQSECLQPGMARVMPCT